MVDLNLLSSKQERLLTFIDFADKIEGKTKLQKLVFLGLQEYGCDVGYAFMRYNYGPYSFELTEDLKILENLGLIFVDRQLFDGIRENGFQKKKITYQITAKGGQYAGKLKPTYKSYISKLKKFLPKFNSWSLDKIIKYVYAEYM